MAYFLGRDVKVAMTTEHEAFSIKYASSALDIRGTASNAVADDDAIPRRPIGLKASGTSGVAEVSKLTITSATEADFETTSGSSGKYITLYDPDGDSYVMDFETSGGSAFSRTTEGTSATGYLKITLAADEGGAGAIATEIADDINADATFSKLFTASASGAVVSITNAQTGDATDMVRGSGFATGKTGATSDPIIIVGTSTQGVDASNIITDITGVDITVGTVDEDISFLGQRHALKAELKNEMTLVLTRKKGQGSSSAQSHELFAELFNKARCGLLHEDGTIDAEVGETDSKLSFDNSLTIPTASADGANFGYRLHLQAKESKEVITLRNMCMTEYSTTLNSDGMTEETITFYGNAKPVIGTSSNTTLTALADF